MYFVPCVLKIIWICTRLGGPLLLSLQAAGTPAPVSGGRCLSACPGFRWQGNFSCHCSASVLRHQSSGSAAQRETCLLCQRQEGVPEIQKKKNKNKTRMLTRTPSQQDVKCVYLLMHARAHWICMPECLCAIPVSLQYFGIAASKAPSSQWDEPEKKGSHFYFYIILPKGMLI